MSVRQRSNLFLAVLAALTLTLTPALTEAKKPDNPGEGGGGGGEPTNTLLIAPLDPGTFANVSDINDLREVVGTVSTESGDQAAAYWSVAEANGVVTSDLTVLSDGYNAYAINNLGEIVGESFGSAGNYVAVYWPSPSSSAIELPSLPGFDVSVALGINNDGLICGYVSKSALDENGQPIPASYQVPSNRAVIWRVNSPDDIRGPFELPSDGDGSSSTADALNDSDELAVAQVVGYRRSSVSGEGGAFLWEVQFYSDGTVSVVAIPMGDDQPLGINNRGSICGRRFVRSGINALVWSGDTISILDQGKGKNSVPVATALDISDSGLIVGEARTDTSIGAIGRACIWDGVDGSLTYMDDYLEPNSPLVGLINAQAVNAFGDTVGLSFNGAFIAVPVSP